MKLFPWNLFQGILPWYDNDDPSEQKKAFRTKYLEKRNRMGQEKRKEASKKIREWVFANKRFKAAAEQRGLTVTHSDKYGWSHTEPTEELLDFVIENGLTDILINRNEQGYFRVGGGTGTHSGGVEITGKPPRTSSTRKYICPCCGSSVRATKAVNIGCLDCGVQMVIDF